MTNKINSDKPNTIRKRTPIEEENSGLFITNSQQFLITQVEKSRFLRELESVFSLVRYPSPLACFVWSSWSKNTSNTGIGTWTSSLSSSGSSKSQEKKNYGDFKLNCVFSTHLLIYIHMREVPFSNGKKPHNAISKGRYVYCHLHLFHLLYPSLWGVLYATC